MPQKRGKERAGLLIIYSSKPQAGTRIKGLLPVQLHVILL